MLRDLVGEPLMADDHLGFESDDERQVHRVVYFYRSQPFRNPSDSNARAYCSEVSSYRKDAETRAKLVSSSARMRILLEQKDPLVDGFEEPVRRVETAALHRNVVRDLVDVRTSTRREAVRHQCDVVVRSASIRRRRRCLASSASRLTDSSVIGMPSPRASSASASS